MHKLSLMFIKKSSLDDDILQLTRWLQTPRAVGHIYQAEHDTIDETTHCAQYCVTHPHHRRLLSFKSFRAVMEI